MNSSALIRTQTLIATTILTLASHLAFPVRSQEVVSDSIQSCYLLSTKAHQSKDYSTFRRLSERLVAMDPHEYRYRYNLACAYALTADASNAVRTLNFLLDEDYDLALLAETDSDFDTLRSSPEFQKIVARIKGKQQPLNKGRVAFSIREKDLIPEGIAYDPVGQVFFLGSLQKRKIIAIDRQKKVSDFTAPGQDGLLPVLGMKVDAKRRALWAASSYGFYNPAIPRELLGMSGVFKFDLRTGKLLKKYMLPQSEGHFLNDLTICPNGDVYVTDWLVHGIYRISAATDSLERYVDLPRSPNGIDCSVDGTRLFIAGEGIGLFDVATRRFSELKHPPQMILSGDGLYYHENSLIAVKMRKVVRFHLGQSQTEIIQSEALEAYHPLFNLPTTGVIVGDQFYFIANSQLRSYDAEGGLLPLAQLDETRILQVDLRWSGKESQLRSSPNSVAQDAASTHFDVTTLADGVFAAVNRPGGSAVSNAGIIDLGDDVLVFDSFMSLHAASDLAQEVEKRLRKPVRYVVNSHYHKDHTWGNQVFAPQATIISSRLTRELLLGSKVPDIEKQAKELAAEIAKLQAKASAERDDKAKRELMLTVGYYQALLDSYRELKITPPDLGIDKSLTIYGSKRKAELVVPGGGSTAGDLFLYLPEERILFSGDMVFSGMHPYLSESDPGRWRENLEGMQRLKVKRLVPGHGPVADSAGVAEMIEYLEGIQGLASRFHREKKTAEEFDLSQIPERFRGWAYSEIYKTNLKYVLQLFNSVK